MNEPLLRTKAVSKTYQTPDHHGRLVLDHIDFTLCDEEIVAILGKSGSGKSTFLRVLAGLVPPNEGVVEYRGIDVTQPVRGIAMVFQSYALFPWLTVLGNVELGLEALGISGAERRRRAVSAIDLIGLDGFENAYPKELSGGMRQRVGFARALVVDPDILLLDEPFSSLDAFTRASLHELVLDLWQELRPTIVMVTHDVDEAVYLADRVVVMRPRSARVHETMPIGLPRPHNKLAAEYDITRRNVLRAIDRSLATERTTGRTGRCGVAVGVRGRAKHVRRLNPDPAVQRADA
jgi:NitT/TauT family transport system ATP-binding protein